MQDATQPDTCPSDLWDGLSPHQQRVAPKKVSDLWLQWAELMHAVSVVDATLMGVKVVGKVKVGRVSLMPATGGGDEFLAIIDGERGKDSVAAFHRGTSPFRSLVMACWREREGEADWRVRVGRSKAPAGGGPSPFTSGAF